MLFILLHFRKYTISHNLKAINSLQTNIAKTVHPLPSTMNEQFSVRTLFRVFLFFCFALIAFMILQFP